MAAGAREAIKVSHFRKQFRIIAARVMRRAGSMNFLLAISFVFAASGENLAQNYERELSTIKLLFYPT
jgi:hypothetical protein